MSRPHVLIIGASGVFGSRLARLLARRKAFTVTLAGRNPAKSLALQSELRDIDPDGGFDTLALDRDRVAPAELRAIGCKLVIDCSGPFQLMRPNLIEAAIAAPCHYIDLADSQAFLAGIGRFDAAAKAAGVAVISGASSSPCLSHAALDQLTGGWTSIDTIDCAIVPGNQTPKGKSVIDGILSWVGQPAKVFREAQWQDGRGWSGPRTVAIRGLPPRRAMLAEVPDLDIVPARFSPRIRAGFDAGMELGLLNLLIGLSGLAVRLRLFKSALAFSSLGNLIANALDRFGSQDGGMLVEAAGTTETGQSVRAVWQLRAGSGHGPYVPVGPAAALADKILLSGQVLPGARKAAGSLNLADVLICYADLDIATEQRSEVVGPSLFQTVMGSDFDALPAVTQKLHRGAPAIVAVGDATIQSATTLPARLIAKLFRLPTTGGTVPLQVVIESRDGAEYWTRRFGHHHMRSVMRMRSGHIAESFGPVSIEMQLVGTSTGLDMRPVGGRFAGIPLPRFLLPKVEARETSAAGRHIFEVDIALPLVGRLVAYSGSLDIGP